MMDTGEAITIIRRCVEADQFVTLQHFNDRLRQRGLLWADVQSIIDRPAHVKADGQDDGERPRFLIRGRLPDGLRAELVVLLDRDDAGNWAVFITAYYEG